MSDTPAKLPPGLNPRVRQSALWLALPLAALLLAGCAVGGRRFDEASVVSLNPLGTEESFQSSESGLLALEGLWVSTNRQTRFEPITRSQKPRPKPPQVEVVTTLVIQSKTNLADLGVFAVTIASQADGKGEAHTPYLGHLVKLKGLLFLSLSPDILEESSFAFVEQAFQQHWLPTHWFLKVEIKGQTLELGRINETWLRTLLEKQPRTLGHVFGRPEVLTDSPEAMQQFLQRHGHNPETFTLTTFCRRAGTP